MTLGEIVEAVSAKQSSWCRADVVQALCDVLPAMSHMTGQRWRGLIEESADRVLVRCVDLDPTGGVERRASDCRSVWLEPTAPRVTSAEVLAQEEHVIAWAMAAPAADPAPSTTLDRSGLDPLQSDAAASVAGHDGLVLVVGAAGTGKTRMLAAATGDLTRQGRVVFGLAPTSKAARVLERNTRMRSDTVAKLLHEWQRTDRPPEPRCRLPAGATVVVDEASMISTPDLYQLVRLTEAQRWRLVLVGDHRQLQAVGRGGLFTELCANGRVNELEQLHRFTHRWEAAASLKLRAGDPQALDAYEGRGRIVAGTIDDHVERMAQTWIEHDRRGETVALVASTNDHVDVINRHVQVARLTRGGIDPHWQTPIGGEEVACRGDVVVTRRNDRHLITDHGQPIRNRETWTVDEVHRDGSLTVSQRQGHGTVTLPHGYVEEHVRLGYAATEHGYQSDTVTTGVALTGPTTTRRGLYVAATRGRDHNELLVVTDSNDVKEARDVLEGVLAHDRADVPAVTQRRTLAEQDRHARPAQQPVKPAPIPRCSIPDWFGPLLVAARRERDQLDTRLDEREAQRDERLADVETAQSRLRSVEERTGPDRAELADASNRVDLARRRRDDAAQRLNTTGIRGRRHAHRELAIADDRLDRANTRLQDVERSTAPAVAAYESACDRVRQATDAVHDHDLLSQLGRPHRHAAELHERVEALETWEQWAKGKPINITDLATAVDTLTDSNLDRGSSGYRQLGNAVTHWARDTGLERQLTRMQQPTLHHSGLEVGLEL